ncbi:MAG: hypothetical protein ACQEVA_16030 [Myxococcota bacterium]
MKMSFTDQKFLRMLIAGTSFWMVLLLTPRAWVDDPSQQPTATHEAPVRTLEQSDDCLWCEQPVESVDCDESQGNDENIWLHPDAPRPQDKQAPCLDQDGTDPSA